jgi:hypothetical protein
MEAAQAIRERAQKQAKEMVARASLDARGRALVEEGLTESLVSLDEERPNLKPGGYEALVERMQSRVDLLEQVLSDRRRYPEIAEVKIERPLIITGLPRSGTTILHSILAQDPDSRSPLTWETYYPSPPPSADTFETDPRIELWNRENLKPGAQHADPDFRRKHLVGAKLPEECSKMINATLRATEMNTHGGARSYLKWWMQADHHWEYEILRQWLQHLQWRNPRKRWVLKAPMHVFNLPALLASFPDARIVQTHRDPAQVLSSNASLIETIRTRACQIVDRKELGQEMLDMWGQGVSRTIAFRDEHPNVKIVNLGHKQIVTDPMTAVRAIYTAFDIPLTAAAEQKMREFIVGNPRDAHGDHKHSLSDYGLSRELVHERMADYVGRFSAYF